LVMKKLFNDALFIINGDDFSVRSESPMPKWSVSFRKPCSPGNDKKKKNCFKEKGACSMSTMIWCEMMLNYKNSKIHSISFLFFKYLRSQFNWAMHVLWKIKNVNTIWALHFSDRVKTMMGPWKWKASCWQPIKVTL